jgi:hypothetical protein
MPELNTYFIEKETVDGVERAWYEVDGNEYAVTDHVDYGSVFCDLKTLLDVEGRPIASLLNGYIDVSSQVPQHIHDIAKAIREFCSVGA